MRERGGRESRGERASEREREREREAGRRVLSPRPVYTSEL